MDMRPPIRPNFPIFMQFLSKISPNNRLALPILGLHPLENPDIHSGRGLSSFILCHLNQWRIQDFSEVGAPTYDFAKFSQKLHEIERIWTPGGARVQNFTM